MTLIRRLLRRYTAFFLFTFLTTTAMWSGEGLAPADFYEKYDSKAFLEYLAANHPDILKAGSDLERPARCHLRFFLLHHHEMKCPGQDIMNLVLKADPGRSKVYLKLGMEFPLREDEQAVLDAWPVESKAKFLEYLGFVYASMAYYRELNTAPSPDTRLIGWPPWQGRNPENKLEILAAIPEETLQEMREDVLAQDSMEALLTSIKQAKKDNPQSFDQDVDYGLMPSLEFMHQLHFYLEYKYGPVLTRAYLPLIRKANEKEKDEKGRDSPSPLPDDKNSKRKRIDIPPALGKAAVHNELAMRAANKDDVALSKKHLLAAEKLLRDFIAGNPESPFIGRAIVDVNKIYCFILYPNNDEATKKNRWALEQAEIWFAKHGYANPLMFPSDLHNGAEDLRRWDAIYNGELTFYPLTFPSVLIQEGKGEPKPLESMPV